MSPRGVRRTHTAFARTCIVPLLVCGLIDISVPAFADDAAPASVSTSSASRAPDPFVPISPSLLQSPHLRGVLEQSTAIEARRLASATQAGGSDTSSHWCAGGLVLLAGGITAAAVSWARRDKNPQKPEPPVGVVLGTAAGVVGAVMSVKSCRR